MKSYIAAAMLVMIGLSSCGPVTPHRRPHHIAEVYHFTDGRIGYQDGDIWMFFTASDTSRPSTTSSIASSARGSVSGTWARGPAPSEEDIENAESEVEAISEEGLLSEAEAEAADTAAESSTLDSDGGSSDGGGNAGGDSGGGSE